MVDDEALAERQQNAKEAGTPPGKESPAAGSKEGTPKAKRQSSAGGSTGSAATRVRVFVRVRPAVRANETGEDGGGGSAIHVQSPKLWLLENKDKEEGGEQSRKGERSSSPRQFVFDGVLPPDSQQVDVYRAACEETDVIAGVLEGINGCVMCYGQTGAGKTHTLGNVAAGKEGVVWRALSQILSDGGASEREVKLSYVQIYLEAIYDLLDTSSTVDLREDPKEGVVLTGAQMTSLTSVEHAVSVIEAANRNRVTSATAMNDASSRSHSVLVLDVTTRAGSRVLRGKLHLVDLAGSERVKKSEVTGQAFDEAIAINNSLTCLGRCVQALAAGPKGGKPPFRETKLTRLLSAAFGGRANTVLVVCVAPTTSDSFETVNSLAFGQQAMSVKVQAKVNASVDYAALEDELYWKFYETQLPRVKAETAAWAALRPAYESQQVLRVALAAEREKLEAAKLELEALRQARAEAQAAVSGKLARRKKEHDGKMKAMRKQQAASSAEVNKLRALATSAGIPLPEAAPTPPPPAPEAEAKPPSGGSSSSGGEGGGGGKVAGSAAAGAAAGAAAADPQVADDEAARFGAARLGAGTKGSALDGTLLEAAAQAAMAGADQSARSAGTDTTNTARSEEHEATIEAYQSAVEKAWSDVQRLGEETEQVGKLEKESEAEAQRLEREREDMEATLHEVASDLGRLALLYRTQGKAPHAVPLYMTALAIYEKTLGPDHPEVAKDLVNLGNAFCDQNQHAEAVPLYLRALAIDQAALGDDHPEVAMDLSNLGIVYRVQGRRDEAIALFQRAHAIMAAALGPDDPKTLTVARNLSATQVIEVSVNETPRAPPAGLSARLSQKGRTKTEEALQAKIQNASETRDAVLQARVDRATELSTPRGTRPSNLYGVEGTDGGGADADATAAAPSAAEPSAAAPSAAAPVATGPDGTPVMPKLKLNLNVKKSADADTPSATPRSTYSKASSDAARAVADSRAGGKGSARSMLRQHVSKMDYSGLGEE